MKSPRVKLCGLGCRLQVARSSKARAMKFKDKWIRIWIGSGWWESSCASFANKSRSITGSRGQQQDHKEVTINRWRRLQSITCWIRSFTTSDKSQAHDVRNYEVDDEEGSKMTNDDQLTKSQRSVGDNVSNQSTIGKKPPKLNGITGALRRMIWLRYQVVNEDAKIYVVWQIPTRWGERSFLLMMMAQGIRPGLKIYL